MPRNMSGLTLIEVLIALAIIAIALTAVIKAGSQNIRGTNYLQDKMIALWVGREVMSEVQLGLLKLPEGGDGTVNSSNTLGSIWYWRAQEDATANGRIKKIRVRVYTKEPNDDAIQALADLDGYRYHAQ